MNLRSAVEGVIDKSTYDKMLSGKFLGNEIFQDFQGYNSPKDRYFLYWNSPAVSASQLQALFLAVISQQSWKYQTTVTFNFRHLVHGIEQLVFCIGYNTGCI